MHGPGIIWPEHKDVMGLINDGLLWILDEWMEHIRGDEIKGGLDLFCIILRLHELSVMFVKSKETQGHEVSCQPQTFASLNFVDTNLPKKVITRKHKFADYGHV